MSPTVPEVSLTLTPNLSEAEWSAATLTVSLDQPTTVSLTIPLVHSGTASTADWWTSPESDLPGVTIPAGETSVSFLLLPVADQLAEGAESLTLTAVENGSQYTVGANGSATITIADSPADQWRFEEFGTAANNPAVAADNLDLDGDNWNVAQERRFRTDVAIPNNNLFTYSFDPMESNGGLMNIQFQWWRGDPLLRYRIEVSHDLKSWHVVTSLDEALRLVRLADTFTAYDSADGTTWRLMHSVTLLMESSVFAGIALTPNSEVEQVSGIIDSIEITPTTP